MKKMNVKKEILVIMMMIIAILVISSKVFATGTPGSPIQIPTINTTTNPEPTDTNTETNTVAPTTNTVTPTTNTTGSTYENTASLPQTGDASDYAIFLLIAVAIIVAIYAYKKVRDYNVK